MIPNCTAQKLIIALPLDWNRAFTWAVAHCVIFRYCFNTLVSFFGQVATASSASRYFSLLAQKLARVWNCNLPYSAPYFRFDYLIRKFEIPCYYSNIYPTRCNVTQFILSGNCSTCFGWCTTHHQERKQLYLQHLVFVTPLLLSAAILEELEPVWVCCGWRTPPTAHSSQSRAVSR